MGDVSGMYAMFSSVVSSCAAALRTERNDPVPPSPARTKHQIFDTSSRGMYT